MALPSIYLLAGLGAAWVISTGAAGVWAYGAGQDKEKATQARLDEQRGEVLLIATNAAAKVVSELEVKHVTIREQADTIIRESVVYRDCKHDDRVMRNINEARTGIAGTVPAAGGVMPATPNSK